jgi:hypothetical protein
VAKSSHRLYWVALGAATGLVACGPARMPPRGAELGARIGAALEVDHAQIYVTPGGAPEAAALRAAGLFVGDRVFRHDGQGTAASFVNFENGYLELIWLDDGVAVAPGLEREVAARRQRAAWRSTGACPLGVGLRRRPGISDTLPLPFPTERYTPPWVRAGTAIERLGDFLDPAAPALFVVPAYMARDSTVVARLLASNPALAATLAHPLGVRRLTGVRLILPERSRNGAVGSLATAGVLVVTSGTEPTLELTFDGGRRGRRDLRPGLPLVVRY